jgi:glycosyltransferase involved in cell wall biosynthesis
MKTSPPATLFSICIPVRNDPQNLKRCLSGFQFHDLRDCEILVCDDGSTPPLTLADLEHVGVNINLVRQAGQGPAAARNHLARIARGTYLFFVDADTVPQPHMIERARNVIAEHPEVEAFYGSYDDEPAFDTLVSSYKNLFHHYTHQRSANANERVTTFWCGCGVIRRDRYLAMGGLSEFYDKPSIEDIELGARLNATGVSIRIFPQLQVKHLKKWTLRSWVYTDLFCRGIPWVRLMRARKDWTSQLNFSWSQRIANLGALALMPCMALALVYPTFALAGLLALGVFVVLNLPFFRLVRRKRGVLASVAVIPLHIVYALICVASMAAGLLYPPLKNKPTHGV